MPCEKASAEEEVGSAAASSSSDEVVKRTLDKGMGLWALICTRVVAGPPPELLEDPRLDKNKSGCASELEAASVRRRCAVYNNAWELFRAGSAGDDFAGNVMAMHLAAFVELVVEVEGSLLS